MPFIPGNLTSWLTTCGSTHVFEHTGPCGLLTIRLFKDSSIHWWRRRGKITSSAEPAHAIGLIGIDQTNFFGVGITIGPLNKLPTPTPYQRSVLFAHAHLSRCPQFCPSLFLSLAYFSYSWCWDFEGLLVMLGQCGLDLKVT